MVVKQSIINISSFIHDSYATVILSCSEILRKGRFQPFIHFSFVFGLSTVLYNQRSISLSSITLELFCWGQIFWLLILVFSSTVNWLCLMSSLLLIIFVIGLLVTLSGEFLEMFIQLLYSFFLASSFYEVLFLLWGSLPFAHFIYCLPCYPWLSMFYWISDFIDLTLNLCLLLFLVWFSSFWDFLSFCPLAFVSFLSFSKDPIFMFSCFFLIVTPIELYIWFLAWLVCTMLLLPCKQWQSFHICHLECVFQLSSEEYRICFLLLLYIYS